MIPLPKTLPAAEAPCSESPARSFSFAKVMRLSKEIIPLVIRVSRHPKDVQEDLLLILIEYAIELGQNASGQIRTLIQAAKPCSPHRECSASFHVKSDNR
jgi:hypothetical protein